MSWGPFPWTSLWSCIFIGQGGGTGHGGGGGGVTAVPAKPSAEGPGWGQCQPSAVACWWMENHFPPPSPTLHGAFLGHTCALGAAACLGFGLGSETMSLLALNALWAELQQSASLL